MPLFFGESENLSFPSWKIAPRSSYPRAQHPRWATFVRLLSVWLILTSHSANAEESIDTQTITFDIPSQSADAALTEFAEQADLTLVFPDDLVRDRTANALVGEYSLEEGAAILLEGTGLIPSFSNPIVLNITIDETSRSGETAMNTAKKAGLIAIITGALSGGVDAQEPTPAETEVQKGVVTGRVTDATTGASLRGAKVTIDETGQWVRTDGRGEFRLLNVLRGSATLTVSAIGYAEQSKRIKVDAESMSQEFSLSGGSDLEEIIVLGQRSARARALNQERTAAVVSTVVSSDHLGSFNGTTISEALRRAPGITFLIDDVTGDGANIVIRGMEPDLNQVLLNGVRIPEESGRGRSPALNNILTESIESVTISKTLLPSHDSTAAGGLVEIKTKSPLDRGRRAANFSAQYGQKSGSFEEDLLISGTLSAVFGDDFGASLSAQFRDRAVDRIAYRYSLELAEYLPLDDMGVPINRFTSIPADAPFPFESGVDTGYPERSELFFNDTRDTNLSITTTFDKRFGSHTDLRLDLTHNVREAKGYRLSQRLDTLSDYRLVPVDALSGEERYALVSENLFPSLTGVRLARNIGGSLRDGDESTLSVASLSGRTDKNLWSFGYGASFAVGNSERGSGAILSANQVTTATDIFSDAALQNTVNGQIVSPFAPVRPGQPVSFLLPLLEENGLAAFSDVDNYSASLSLINPVKGENERESFNANVRFSPAVPFVEYVEIGGLYESSKAFSVFDAAPRYTLSAGTLPTDIGLEFSASPMSRIDSGSGAFGIVSEANLARLLARLPEFSSGANALLNSSFFARPSEANDTFTIEDEVSAYFESQLKFGKLDLVGGVRITTVDLTSKFFAEPMIFSPNSLFGADPSYSAQFIRALTTSSKTTDTLPRISANYRQSDNLIYRAGYYRSVSRPSLIDLSDSQSISYFDFGGTPVMILRQGNPDLQPAKTDNFDLTAELYNENIGVLKLSLFYKTIDNTLSATFVEGDASVLPENLVLPPAPEFDDLSGTDVIVSQPVNRDDGARIFGAEMTGEYQLRMLPNAWSGLGLYFNYTYTDSEREAIIGFAQDEDIVISVPFEGQPEHAGTAGITYSMHGIDASLLYTFQERFATTYRPNGLHRYRDDVETLDLLLEYQLPSERLDARVFLSGVDLLNGSKEEFTTASIGGDDGVPRYNTEANFYGGRLISAGIRVSF